MPAVSVDQIKDVIARFLPKSITDNPFVKALMAGGAVVGILLATPAFAPIGVVGATGWIIVYVVTTGTFSWDIGNRMWAAWKAMGEDGSTSVDEKLTLLKRLRDEGAIDEDEYRRRVKATLDEVLGTPPTV